MNYEKEKQIKQIEHEITFHIFSTLIPDKEWVDRLIKLIEKENKIKGR